MRAVRNDVIQLDPSKCDWGALLCIVDETHDEWGVRCYALLPDQRGTPPNRMFLRVNHGDYVIIGQVEWAIA